MRLFEIEDVIDRERILNPVKQEVPMNKPGGWTVMLLNDPVTPAEVVVDAIMFGAGLSEQEARRRMMKAHTEGWVPIAAYASKDLAETVAEKIMSHARNNKNYDNYKQFTRPRHFGPWQLTAEVMESGI